MQSMTLKEKSEIMSSLLVDPTRKSSKWIDMYISASSILSVLITLQRTLDKMGLYINLQDLEPLDMIVYWRKQIEFYINEPLVNVPNPYELSRDTIRDFVSSIRVTLNEHIRHREFFEKGPPPGVSEYPKDTSENVKYIEVPMVYRRKYASADEHTEQFKSYQKYLNQFRRIPTDRSQKKVDDINYPEAFI